MTEDFDTLDAGMGNTGLTLSSIDTANLRTAGKWGRFIAITGLAMIGFAMVSMLIFGGSMLATMGSSIMGGSGAFSLILVVYGLAFAVSIYLYWQLLQFSTNAIKAADQGNSAAMTASFTSLKTMFKILGVLLGILLGIYALTFVFAIFGGLASII
jgi:hypothetical protein